MSLSSKSAILGRPLTILNTTASSNNYAIDQVRAGSAVHGAAYFALEQTAGKGQRGKTWLTEPGQNIVVSAVISPAVYGIIQPFVLNWLVSLAAFRLLDSKTNGDVSIKWPNDIYWRDRKAAGILIENIYQGNNWNYAIVGMGMNINQVQFSPEAVNPVSMRQITGKEHDPLVLTADFFGFLEEEIDVYVRDGAGAVLGRYNDRLYKKGVKVRLKKENSVFETTIEGVNIAGQLCTFDVLKRSFNWGEVEWVR